MHLAINFRDAFLRRLPIRGGGFSADAEAQDVRDFVGLEAHRGEHVRGFFLAGRAGRAGAHGKAGFVKACHPAEAVLGASMRARIFLWALVKASL